MYIRRSDSSQGKASPLHVWLCTFTEQPVLVKPPMYPCFTLLTQFRTGAHDFASANSRILKHHINEQNVAPRAADTKFWKHFNDEKVRVM